MSLKAYPEAEKKDFDPHDFLSTIGEGRRMISFSKRATIFQQGDASNGLFLIQKGKVQLTVLSDSGKEATLGILKEGDFFGESGLADQLLRSSTATAMTECMLLQVEKSAMMLALSVEPKLSALFLRYLLDRGIRYQDDLVDQLFNSSEKRLARVILLMARFGQQGVSQRTVPKLSQEVLAEMVGTTRSRVSFFMNRFRKRGFIDYDGGNNLLVHSSLLNVVLHDEGETGGASTRTAKVPRDSGNGGPPQAERARRPALPAVQQVTKKK